MTAKNTTTVRYAASPIGFAEPVELMPGILWLRLPLPFALDHVNLWLLDDGDGWTLVDTGYADERSRAHWEVMLAGALAGRPIRRIVATHFHPDHVGLAGWLVERLGAECWMSRTEWLTARMLAFDSSPGYAAVGREFDEAAGLSEALIAERFTRGNRYRLGVTPAPPRFRRLAAGDLIRMGGSDWRVIIGEGHAPEMLTFHSPERGILIAADQILPRISPIIGVWPSAPEADPLADFLRTLPPYLGLPEDCLVLPSHDAPFHGLHARVNELVRHHEIRLDQVLEVCREPITAADIIPRLFRRRLDAHQLGFALGETMAHVNHLLRRGTLQVAGRQDRALLYRRS